MTFYEDPPTHLENLDPISRIELPWNPTKIFIPYHIFNLDMWHIICLWMVHMNITKKGQSRKILEIEYILFEVTKFSYIQKIKYMLWFWSQLRTTCITTTCIALYLSPFIISVCFESSISVHILWKTFKRTMNVFADVFYKTQPRQFWKVKAWYFQEDISSHLLNVKKTSRWS